MRTFRSLRHTNYRLYFIGQMVSLVGSWTQTTTLMWLAHEQTLQAKWPAFLTAAQIGPTLLFGAWGGALADRVRRRPLIMATQSAFLITALGLILLYYTGLLNVWTMIAVMAYQGLVQAIDLPSRLAFVPNLVSRDDLINAVALNSLLFNVARAAGPALAGLLLHWAGPGVCFIANAVSYLAVILALALMKIPPEIDRSAKTTTSENGFRLIARQRNLLVLICLAGLVAVGGWPLMSLLPKFSHDLLQSADAQGYSTLLSAVGAGALTAALSAATYGTIARRKIFLIGGICVVALSLMGLSQAVSHWMAILCCGCFGFGMILFFATGQSAVQLGVEDENRGKVMGIWAMVLSAGVPLGNLAFGPLADIIGVRSVLLVQGGIVALACATLAWLYSQRARERASKKA